MKQVLQHVRSGKLELAEVPEPAPRRGGIVVRNAASLISAGTERTIIDFAGKSLLGKARERPDLVRQVVEKVRREGLGPTFQAVTSRLDQPMPLGYSCAGVVESAGSGAPEFRPGDRVACAGMGYASHAHAVYVPRNLAVHVPDGVSFEDASYVTLGAIALQGVRTAEPRLGETIAVIGLGLLGQLTVQILRAAGCRVVGIDLDPAKVALARELGAELALLRTADVRAELDALTGGIGADAVIVAAAADSNDPIELAGELCRDRGIVSMVGAVRMDIPRKVYYDKELQLRLSRSYGPGRYDPAYEEEGRDYPIGYVRWTERRNLAEFLRLVAGGQVTPSRLTTHRFDFEEAPRAYAVVTGEDRQPFLGVVLTYPAAAPGEGRTVVLRAAAPAKGRTGIGVIGAGNFARAVLLPRLARTDAALVGVATATGTSARATGDRFAFGYCTTDVERVLEDPAVHAVVIATRHGSHASLATRALRAGKGVFVEKPLALDEAGLAEVLAAQAETGGVLTVGFNRRFSPLVARLREAFAPGLPLALNYRINAGAIPRESWIHDPEQGGGRIVGELCHFVDLVQHVADDEVEEVFAFSAGGADAALHDVVAATLRLARGSVATLSYYSSGDRAFPKERLEVFGGGVVAVLDDFRELTVSRAGKRTRVRRLSQEKGFDEEIAAFLTALRSGGTLPIPLRSLAITTRATFAIETSLRTGAPVRVEP